jgi:hypothetical protein
MTVKRKRLVNGLAKYVIAVETAAWLANSLPITGLKQRCE